MSYSLNEFEALCKKAAKGSGLFWGHAEEPRERRVQRLRRPRGHVKFGAPFVDGHAQRRPHA